MSPPPALLGPSCAPSGRPSIHPSIHPTLPPSLPPSPPSNPLPPLSQALVLVFGTLNRALPCIAVAHIIVCAVWTRSTATLGDLLHEDEKKQHGVGARVVMAGAGGSAATGPAGDGAVPAAATASSSAATEPEVEEGEAVINASAASGNGSALTGASSGAKDSAAGAAGEPVKG